jgi:hypothetical protein
LKQYWAQYQEITPNANPAKNIFASECIRLHLQTETLLIQKQAVIPATLQKVK